MNSALLPLEPSPQPQLTPDPLWPHAGGANRVDTPKGGRCRAPTVPGQLLIRKHTHNSPPHHRASAVRYRALRPPGLQADESFAEVELKQG